MTGTGAVEGTYTFMHYTESANPVSGGTTAGHWSRTPGGLGHRVEAVARGGDAIAGRHESDRHDIALGVGQDLHEPG